MKNKKRYFLLLIILIFILTGYYFIETGSINYSNLKENSKDQIKSGKLEIPYKNITIPVEIADTKLKRSLGLSKRASLDKNSGLLFVFEKPGIYGFWMKDMNFPIDIIWIDDNWTIVDITKNISPETFPKTFTPSSNVKYVLEVNAGFAEENNIKIKDQFNFIK